MVGRKTLASFKHLAMLNKGYLKSASLAYSINFACFLHIYHLGKTSSMEGLYNSLKKLQNRTIPKESNSSIKIVKAVLNF